MNEMLKFLGFVLLVFVVADLITLPCECEKLPDNYFIIESKETEMCVDENRKTFITKVTKSGRVERN